MAIDGSQRILQHTNLANPIVVFVESNTTGTGAELIERAVQRGQTTIVLTRDPARYRFLERISAEIRTIDTTDSTIVVQELSGLNVGAICTTSDPFTAITAAAAKALGCPGPAPNACEQCLDKRVQVNILERAGVRVPPTTFVASRQRVSHHMLGDGPWIIKPIRGSGSMNVRICKTLSQIDAFLTANEGNSANGWLIQSFVGGPEFSVELVLDPTGACCLGVLEKRIGAPPARIETGHFFPAAIGTTQHDALIRTALEAVRALGFDFGCFHVELICTADGISLIEVNPRLAGGGIPFMISATTGRDLLEDWLSLHLTGYWPKRVCVQPSLTAAIAFRVMEKDGLLMSIRAPLQRPSSIVRTEALRYPGELLVRCGDFRDRILSAIAVAPQSVCAMQIADSYLGDHLIELSPTF